MLKKQYLTYFFHFPTLSTSKKCVPLHPKYDKRHLSNTAQGLCPSGRFFALPAMDSVVRPHRPRPGFLMGQPACHGDTILRGLAAREVSRLRPSRRHLVSRALAFSVFTFFYASMLFAVAQYVYFRFLDNGALVSMLLSSIKALEPFYRAQGVSVEGLRQSIAMIGDLSPVEIAFVFMMQNIFMGFFMSFPIALITRRSTTRRGANQ